jgi:hypothetical protein
MAKPEAEQLGLEGVPQPPKRKVIKALEQLGLDDDELAAKITALNDERAELRDTANKKLTELGLEVYTYKRADGVFYDLINTSVLRKKKSKSNPKPKKKAEE